MEQQENPSLIDAGLVGNVHARHGFGCFVDSYFTIKNLVLYIQHWYILQRFVKGAVDNCSHNL